MRNYKDDLELKGYTEVPNYLLVKIMNDRSLCAKTRILALIARDTQGWDAAKSRRETGIPYRRGKAAYDEYQVKEIAEKLELTRRTVRSSLRELYEEKYLHSENTKRKYKKRIGLDRGLFCCMDPKTTTAAVGTFDEKKNFVEKRDNVEDFESFTAPQDGDDDYEAVGNPTRPLRNKTRIPDSLTSEMRDEEKMRSTIAGKDDGKSWGDRARDSYNEHVEAMNKKIEEKRKERKEYWEKRSKNNEEDILKDCWNDKKENEKKEDEDKAFSWLLDEEEKKE
jgi:DNA-binding transcriptional ArsR family regulator